MRHALFSLTILAAIPTLADAQGTPNNAVGVWGQDTGTGLPCIIAPVGGSGTCVLPSGVTANGTFDDAAVGTVSMAVPDAAGMTGLNLSGDVKQWTAVNPSGSIIAGQVDLSSIDGVTAKTGNGTNTGALRVVIASDNDSLAVSGAVTTSPTAVTPTDRGGTITTGGTAQVLAGANASRKGLVVQNPCGATEDLFLSTTGTAVEPAASPDDVDLPACGSWSATTQAGVNQASVSVIAATTGHVWLAKETQ